ncbi:MAG: V-type ATP synthase subunit F [Candidatus Marsarchaeota archaeon]|nr:V-type ATP synthase subunit F [Candidatus Marsarchaeota archaeon]
MQFDRIAVVGEREIALGFELVGVSDVFISSGEEAVKKLGEIMGGKDYGLVIVSDSVRRKMGSAMLRAAETALKPLVVFVPAPTAGEEEESVEALAKRVLGVDIKSVK